MKHIITTKVWLLIIIWGLAISANAQTTEVDGINYALFSEDGVMVVARDGKYSGDIVIPEKVNITITVNNKEYSGERYVFAIDDNAFKDCTELTSLVIPDIVYSIGEGAFSGCTALKSIALPNSLTQIKRNTFNNCSWLEKLVIPEKVESIGEYTFYNCGIKTLVMQCSLNSYKTGNFSQYSVFYGLRSDARIYAHTSEIENIRKVFDGTIFSLDIPYNVYVDSYSYYLKGFHLHLIKNEYMDEATLLEIRIGGNSYKPFDSLNDMQCIVDGLQPNTLYEVQIVYFADGEEHIVDANTKLRTKSPEFYLSHNENKYYSTNQTSIHINYIEYNFENDPTVNMTEIGVSVNGVDYAMREGEKTIDITGLSPNHSYSVTPYIIHDGTEKITGQYNTYIIKTKPLQPNLKDIELTPTTFKAIGTHADGDAILSETYFSVMGKVVNSDTIFLESLEPNSNIQLRYTVMMESGYSEYYDYNIQTPTIEFTTLTPKISNKGEAIVAATTNISDTEENAGFEWRKVDAPDIVPSKSAKAVIYEGRLEGLIKNLDETTYYQVRPYYESAAGNKYYGDWIGFDPSDFSYFEPTVHTYANAVVTEGTVIISGYALGGSDEIEEQGFEYWTIGISQTQRVPSTDVQTVKANGQRMTIELTGLTAGTTYGYRAFVKTTKGMFYGEERQFSTLVSSGIETPAIASPTKTIVGYYSLQGKKQNGMQRGINIVRYSDGTTKKVMVR